MTSRVVSLKLYIDTKARKILYAEADKHFVDYLFYILSLPISSVVKLLFTDSTLGSLGILYNKSHKKNYVTDRSSYILCPECSCNYMSTELPYVIATGKVMPSGNECGGFVKGDVTYMVMDDLEVRPLSTASSISVLSKLNVKDVGSVQELEECLVGSC
nr:Mitochondrial distribution and morphology protein [Ipomoea batatas]